MLQYTPPVDDAAFLLGPWLGAEQAWARCPDYAHVDLETVNAVLAEAGRFCADVLAPINASGDAQGCRLVDGQVHTPDGYAQAYARFVEDGWATLSQPPELGGQGLPGLVDIAFAEMQASANHAWSMYPGLLAGAIACLRAHADPALVMRFVPNLVSGQWLATMCLTEPQAGSDLSLLRSRAEADTDGSYRLHGNKIFISGGSHDLTANTVHLVLARLPDAPAGSRGISLFVVPQWLEDGSANGVHCDGIEHKMGLRGSATTALRLEGARGWLVGQPHRGLAAMFVMMNSARLHVAMQGVGHADRARQLATAYARERRQMRTVVRSDASQPADTIDRHPPIHRTLQDLAGWSEGMRAAGYWLAQQIDLAESSASADERAQAQALAELLTPVAKAYFTGHGHALANRALQVFGGYGYIAEYGIEQVVRDSRIALIYEGTNEIQAIDLLLRKLGGDAGRARLQVLLSACERVITDARLAGLAQPAARLERMLRRIERLLARIDAAATRDPQAPYRCADAVLQLFGHALLAMVWLDMQRVALPLAGTVAAGKRALAGWMSDALDVQFRADLLHVRAQLANHG